jgi:hypothetical protein
MSERTNTVRYFLNSKEFGKKLVGDIEKPILAGGNKYTLTDKGYFSVEGTSQVVMRQEGYEYLFGIRKVYGANVKVDFITEVKDDRSLSESWTRRPTLKVNMYTLSFEEDKDNLSVSCDLVTEGDLKAIEAGFEDDFDIVGVDAPEMDYVTVRHEPRRIVKKSRFIGSTITVNAEDDQGKTARAIPLELDYSSDKEFIGEVSNVIANSVNDTYASQSFSGNMFIQNAPRDLLYTVNGLVEIETMRRSDGGAFTIDLVRFSGGGDRNFEEVITNLASGNTGDAVGTITSVNFNDYKLIVNEGDSIGLLTLSEGDDGGVSFLYWEYKTTENTFFELVTETPYPVTYSKAIRPRTAFRQLSRIILSQEKYEFVSAIFGPGGIHENKLLVHGTWLRNMPEVLNEGTTEERRVQANLSLETLYGGYSLLEPLRYDVPFYKGSFVFTVGAFKEIQQNFKGVPITSIREPSKLVEVSAKGRDVLGENHYRTVKIGSETSGSNYGAVNNLFSTSGFASWSTPHVESEGAYEVLSKVRTGAEDVEVQRQFQFSDNPDEDGESDDDWFIIDAEEIDGEFVARKWDYYYEEIPTGVYSPETNYNWPFAPVEMLRAHSYKINAGLIDIPGAELTNPTGNCTLSLITKKVGEARITSNEAISNDFFDKPRIELLLVGFETPITPEIIEALEGETQGVDNKFGIVEIMYNGKLLKGRLFEATTDEIAKFKIIQASI